MGVLNLTPDSFSDGGRWTDPEVAFERAQLMFEQGAAIIDIGGESTRPGAEMVSEQEELDRVMPVIEAIVERIDCPVSIDTMKPAVMRAACSAGVSMVNDVNALRSEGALEVAASSGVAVCLMHMQGAPSNMQASPKYEDVVEEVGAFLRHRIQACLDIGISGEVIAVDPGFGFGKSLENNLQLLRELESLCQLGFPLLVGLSRKSMFQQICGAPVQERLPASLAAATMAVLNGANIVRAHDVAETIQAVKVAAVLRNMQTLS